MSEKTPHEVSVTYRVLRSYFHAAETWLTD